MDIDDYQKLRHKYSLLTDDELAKVVNAPNGEYRAEAVMAAKDVVLSRLPRTAPASGTSDTPPPLSSRTLSDETRKALESLIATVPEPPKTLPEILFGWRGRLDHQAHTSYFSRWVVLPVGISIVAMFISEPLGVALVSYWPVAFYIYLAMKHKREKDMGESSIMEIFMTFEKYSSLRSGQPYPTSKGIPFGTSREDWSVNPNDPDLPFFLRGEPLRNYVVQKPARKSS